MNTTFLKVAAPLIAAILGAGCASPVFKTTQVSSAPVAGDARSIKVFKERETVPGKYEILGVVSGIGEALGAKAYNKATLRKLQAEAATLGADALMGYYVDYKTDAMGHYTWSSAVAVRMLKESEQPVTPKVECLVAIPHAVLAQEIASGARGDKLNSAARRFAQLHLARKGYYGVLVEQTLPDASETGLPSLDDVDLSDFAGVQPDLVLSVQFLRRVHVSIGVASREEIVLQTVLYSRAQKRVIWQGEGGGFGQTGWLLDITAANAKRIAAVGEAVKVALQTLPDIATKTRKK